MVCPRGHEVGFGTGQDELPHSCSLPVLPPDRMGPLANALPIWLSVTWWFTVLMELVGCSKHIQYGMPKTRGSLLPTIATIDRGVHPRKHYPFSRVPPKDDDGTQAREPTSRSSASVQKKRPCKNLILSIWFPTGKNRGICFGGQNLSRGNVVIYLTRKTDHINRYVAKQHFRPD